jgi:hypothetical protein
MREKFQIGNTVEIVTVRVYIEKFPDWVGNEMNNNDNNKHSLASNTKGYGRKTH